MSRQPVHDGRPHGTSTGTPPYLPDACRDLGGDVIHTSRYLERKAALQAKDSITVVGSGQSASEIYHDLLATPAPSATGSTGSPGPRASSRSSTPS